MLETAFAGAAQGGTTLQELPTHALVDEAIMLLPGKDDFGIGLAALHEAMARPDYVPLAAYRRIVAAGGLLAMSGNMSGGRRLHHACIALHAQDPAILDTEPAARLAEALTLQPAMRQAA